MKKIILLILLVSILLSGCEESIKLDKDYATSEMVPELNSDGYVTVPVGDINKKIETIGTIIPEPTAKVIAGTASFVGCMEGKGAWSAKAYYHKDEIAVGLAASTSMKESADALNLGYCAMRAFVVSGLAPFSIVGEFEPRICNWKIKTPNDILYNIVIVSHRGMYSEICDKIPGGCSNCEIIAGAKESTN